MPTNSTAPTDSMIQQPNEHQHPNVQLNDDAVDTISASVPGSATLSNSPKSLRRFTSNANQTTNNQQRNPVQPFVDRNAQMTRKSKPPRSRATNASKETQSNSKASGKGKSYSSTDGLVLAECWEEQSVQGPNQKRNDFQYRHDAQRKVLKEHVILYVQHGIDWFVQHSIISLLRRK